MFKTRLLIFCLLIGISCQSASQKEASLLAQDARAKTELSRIGQSLSIGYPLTAQDFETIKQLREKYPNLNEVRNVYQNALIRRGDWESLVKLIEAVPDEQRTGEDRLNLLRSYLKLGRYQDAVDSAKPLAEANPKDTDYNSLLAFAYFQTGRNDEAAKHLDAVWDAILKNKKIDEINTRGMIYFRQKNYAQAIETFKKSLEINPNDISANNTLSRIYAAQGDAAQAEIYRAKTEQAQAEISASETKASRMVQNSYQLEDAWKAKRYEEVIALARQMLADADAKNKPALYQYLVESYKALGKPEEAQKIITEAQNSKQK